MRSSCSSRVRMWGGRRPRSPSASRSASVKAVPLLSRGSWSSAAASGRVSRFGSCGSLIGQGGRGGPRGTSRGGNVSEGEPRCVAVGSPLALSRHPIPSMTQRLLPPRPERPAPRLQVGSTPSVSSIPSELYRDAGRRVQIAARAFLGIWVVVLVVSNLTHGFTPEWYRHSGWYMYGNYIYAAGIALALAALAMARFCEGRPERTTRLGLALLVGTSALIAFGNQWGEMPGGAGVSWAAAIVLLYPAIVPVSMREMLIAGAIACSWDLLFRLLAEAIGASPAPSGTEWVWLVVPNAMC